MQWLEYNLEISKFCSEKCPSNSSAKCANGGTPHPRDCNTCLCPSEFGGQFCDERVKLSVAIIQLAASARYLWKDLFCSIEDGEEYAYLHGRGE